MKLKTNFLPVNRRDMIERGWDSCDIILITGDAYVDHPSFGAALISRMLEAHGYRLGIIAQPRWDSKEDFTVLGRPKLAYLITAGNVDSMVAHYTSAMKKRSTDTYSPGGKSGLRCDRAVITYTSRARQAYKDVPVIIGGLEASLRRLSHYDYWSDRIRSSILLDSKADMLIYGMGEHPVTEVCRRLSEGQKIGAIDDVRGTVVRMRPSGFTDAQRARPFEEILLPDFLSVSERDKRSNQGTAAGKTAYARSIQLRLLHANHMKPERLIEHYGHAVIVQNPPSLPMSTEEMDRTHMLPYMRKAHPMYDAAGGVPAVNEIRFSITSSRGCYGGCTFCALTSHQGRFIQTRSRESIVAEALQLKKDPEFKGYIHDIGGPTANFRAPSCKKQERLGLCSSRECLFPEPCPSLQDSHAEYLSVLKEVRELPGIKKVFIRSGIRYDYLYAAADEKTRRRFLRELCEHHVSGQLKVAPEHVSHRVLDKMGKPDVDVFDRFSSDFKKVNEGLQKKQYIIPYFISGHPGSKLEDAIKLACYLKKHRFVPDQVQDFYPTPGTVATCMYYTGLDPRPGRGLAQVYIPKGREKHLQRALIHFHKKENRNLVREALIQAGRRDLIGNGRDCLIPR